MSGLWLCSDMASLIVGIRWWWTVVTVFNKAFHLKLYIIRQFPAQGLTGFVWPRISYSFNAVMEFVRFRFHACKLHMAVITIIQ